ncbi:MAG: Flp pilus assembly complex ATPase component TadA, partial [Myxococcales bacterium]|nr:Flp pilus assembly complex ATPase component TadA [Myxococcales bacterium]
MNLTFVIAHADGRVEQAHVTADHPVTIGREATNDIVLPSPEVSRRHLTIDLTANGLILTDSSANGTKLGEQKMRGQSTQWTFGTPIGIGPFVVTIQSDAPPQSVDVTAPPAAPAPSAGRTDAPSSAASATAPKASARPKATEAPKAAVYRVGARGSAPEVPVELRRKMHRMLLDHLDLAALDQDKMDVDVMRPRVRAALRRIVTQVAEELPKGTDTAELIDEITDEALGLGPLEKLLADETVSEIMVVDPHTIYIERAGRVELTDLKFTDNDLVRAVIERIVTPLGRRIDESSP